jgi:hypothetical protein
VKSPNKKRKYYWDDHEYHKISMDEVVKDYCGDRTLLELVKKCDEVFSKTKKFDFRKRNKALVAALFLTGGRNNEVLLLETDNFNFSNQEATESNAFLVKNMRVLKRTRSRKSIFVSRTFPIWYDDPLVDYLIEWIKEIDGYLFSNGPTGELMTESRPFQIVRELGKHLARPLHINPSWFRKQRQYYLIKKKGFSPYDLQAYFKLKYPPHIFRAKEDWQNLLAITRPFREEKLYETAPYDALRDLQKLFLLARKEIDIIDPYVDDSLFNLYLEDIDPSVKIKLITKNMYKKFKDVAKRFKIQRPNFEVRSIEDIHDRYLIVDNKVWIIGSSLNKAGMKPFYIIELNDKKRILALFQKLWNNAKIEI